jgi:hypothetical protein
VDTSLYMVTSFCFADDTNVFFAVRSHVIAAYENNYCLSKTQCLSSAHDTFFYTRVEILSPKNQCPLPNNYKCPFHTNNMFFVWDEGNIVRFTAKLHSVVGI